MELIKKVKLKILAISLGILSIGAIGFAGIVSANVDFRSILADKLADKLSPQVLDSLGLNEVPAVQSGPSEAPLGAQAREIINERRECWNQNDCTFHVTGNYADATDTLFVIPDPFLKATSTMNDVVIADAGGQATSSPGNDLAIGFTGDTSTVELIRLKTRTTGTVDSNLVYTCGTAANGFGTTSTRSQYLIATPQATTGTAYQIESGMVSSTIGALGNSNDAVVANGFFDAVSSTVYGAPLVNKILLTPAAPYVFCRISNPDKTNRLGGLTGATSTGNTFTGQFVIRISGQP